MKSLKLLVPMLAAVFMAAPALAATTGNSQGQVLVTILPKSGATFKAVNPQPGEMQLKINGKAAQITSVTHARGPASPIELVLLIDGSARDSIGTQLSDITDFINELPSDTRMAIAYMENGRAAFTGPFSSDPKVIRASLRIPEGPAGVSGSPYFCLSDLAQHWPSHDTSARREVVMITDGIDNYEPRFNPDDPYVASAIKDSARAGLTVYSIYWKSEGPLANSEWISSGGQSLLLQVADATGGASYWQGFGNPVSFSPYFAEIRVRLGHQYKIGFATVREGKPEVKTIQLKLKRSDAKLSAPQLVLVTPENGE